MVSSSGSCASACIPPGTGRAADVAEPAASTVETGTSASNWRRESGKSREACTVLGHHPRTIPGHHVIDRPGARSGQRDAKSRGGKDHFFLPGDLASVDKGGAPE